MLYGTNGFVIVYVCYCFDYEWLTILITIQTISRCLFQTLQERKPDFNDMQRFFNSILIYLKKISVIGRHCNKTYQKAIKLMYLRSSNIDM